MNLLVYHDTMNLLAHPTQHWSPSCVTFTLPWSADSAAFLQCPKLVVALRFNPTCAVHTQLKFAFLWFIKHMCYQILTSRIQRFRHPLPKQSTWTPVCSAAPGGTCLHTTLCSPKASLSESRRSPESLQRCLLRDLSSGASRKAPWCSISPEASMLS